MPDLDWHYIFASSVRCFFSLNSLQSMLCSREHFFAMLGINEGDWQAKPVGHPKGHPLALVVCGLLGATFKLLNCIELLNSV